MSTWQKYKLGDICKNITDGKHGDCQNHNNSGYYFISSKDVYNGSIHYENARQITEKDFLETHRRTRLEAEDILITNSGTIGRMALIRRSDYINRTTFQKSVAILKTNKDKANSAFMYYILLSNFKRLVNLGGGAAQHNLLLGDLRKFELYLPSIQVQNSIASVLSTYDDLIENNEKRIKVLEEMAQRLYTEWFVNFNFPMRLCHPELAEGSRQNIGYKDAGGKMIDSGTSYGKIPEGWGVKEFYDVVHNFDSKRKPLSSIKRQLMTGSFPYYGAAKVIDNVNNYIFDGKYLLIAEDGSVITSDGKPVLQFVNEKFWVSNHAHVVSGKLLSTESVYLRMKLLDVKPLITGAAQPKITKENLSRAKFVVPNNIVNEAFKDIAENIFNEIFKIKERNKTLRHTRDLLIPQLVTGKRQINSL